MQKKFLQWLRLPLIVLGFSLFAPVLGAQQLVKGQDFMVIDPPIKTNTPDRIEVMEFFSYACNHCNDLHPIISEWAKQLPKDVVFKRSPIPGSAFYTMMAKGYYALEAVGLLQKLDTEVFNAIHKGARPPFNDPKSLAKWVGSKGGDADKFLDAFNSFGVDGKVRLSGQQFDNAGLSGVPAIVVDGRYQVLGKNVNGFTGLIELTDKVIAMRRAERSKGEK